LNSWGDPNLTTVSVRRLPDGAYEETYKKGDTTAFVTRMTPSPNGKTLTTVFKDKESTTTAIATRQ